jgi:uncharacterized protein with beta-barrel porin domain
MNKYHGLKRRNFGAAGILGTIILTALGSATTAKAAPFFWTNNNGVNNHPEVIVGSTTVGTGTNIDGMTTTQGTISINLSAGSNVSTTGDAITNSNSAATSTITVLGNISTTGNGINLAGGGSITNSAIIANTGQYGIVTNGNTTLVNNGTISNSGGGAFEAVRFFGTSTVTNNGTILGTVYGIGIGLNSTLTNFGIITGPADSVFYNNPNGTVIVKTDSQFNGTIEGAGQTNAKLVFDLTGLTKTEKSQFVNYLDANQASGTFTIQGETYTWADFNNGTVTLLGGVLTFASQAVTPNQRNIAVVLDGAPAPGASMQTLLNNLTNSGNIPGSLDALSPQKLQILRSIAYDNFGFSAIRLDDHLASLRYGGGGFDASGLEVLDSSTPAMLSQIKGRLLAWNPSPASKGLVSDMPNPVMAGVDMKQIAPAANPNRWSTFVSGNVVLADIGHDSDVNHSNYTTGGVTAGADYRLDDNWTVGGLFGYGHTDATLDPNGSGTRVDSYSPGVYAAYVDHGWYANGLFAYNYNSYSEDRAIPFMGSTAHGAPDGNQFDTNLDGGYEFRSGNWTFGPTAALQYVHLDVNSFTETGAGAANLNINEQNADSLRSRIGGEVRYNWSWYGGKVTATPHLSASWQHEYLDNSAGITSQFDGQGLGSFTVQTTSPDRDSAMIDAGLDTQWNSALNLFVDYQAQAGQSNFFAQSVEAGVKVSF